MYLSISGFRQRIRTFNTHGCAASTALPALLRAKRRG
jgi:hypothetical protein